MRKTQHLLLCATLMALPLAANSQEQSKWAAGFHSGNLSSGFSVKYRNSDVITAQLTAGLFGTLSSFSVRGLYNFKTGPDYEMYGYGSIGQWRWGGSGVFNSESVIGFGAGAGIEYDLRAVAPTLPPLYASAELGINVANFDNYGGFSTMGIGLGLHYRF